MKKKIPTRNVDVSHIRLDIVEDVPELGDGTESETAPEEDYVYLTNVTDTEIIVVYKWHAVDGLTRLTQYEGT